MSSNVRLNHIFTQLELVNIEAFFDFEDYVHIGPMFRENFHKIKD